MQLPKNRAYSPRCQHADVRFDWIGRPCHDGGNVVRGFPAWSGEGKLFHPLIPHRDKLPRLARVGGILLCLDHAPEIAKV